MKALSGIADRDDHSVLREYARCVDMPLGCFLGPPGPKPPGKTALGGVFEEVVW